MLGYLRSGNKRTKLIWWVVTISTVATFLIGFSFIGAMGRDPSIAARQSGVFGSVNGEKVSREMWANAIETERQAYRQRYNSAPVDRDLRALEQSAWRKLVDGRLLSQEAARAGLTTTDNDVIFRLETDPPASLLSAPAFQTNGHFDPEKYRSAVMNPANSWTSVEEQVRQDTPGLKLQKTLMSSLKLSEGEMRQALLDRYVRLSAVVLCVPPADSGKAPAGDAELQRVYDAYKVQMASPARTQLELLAIPVEFSKDEIKTATDVANGLYQRAQRGEDFAQLVRDYSEGPNAERGGVVDRAVTLQELGPLAQQVAAAGPGGVLPPLRQGAAMLVFRVLGPQQDSTARNLPAGSVKLAELTVKIHPGSDALRAEYEKAIGIAKRARDVGLSRAAAERGLSTTRTGFFDLDNMPPQLFMAPEAADWGVTHPQGAVSAVFQTPEVFLIAQVAVQHKAGIPTRAEVSEQLSQLADLDHRVTLAKPRADQVAAAVHGGTPLEDAARAAGLPVMPLMFTRAQPDPRIGGAPELIGALFGAKPGVVVGPFRTPTGWYFGRLAGVAPPPDTVMTSPTIRGQLTTDILGRRQRSFFSGYMTLLRERAKVEDNRSAFGTSN